MSDNDITELVDKDDIHDVLKKSELNVDESVGLDFAHALLYHIEDALVTRYSSVGTCQCAITLQVADLVRGYCVNCFGAITVRVSGKVLRL